jgi:hypothetical protein
MLTLDEWLREKDFGRRILRRKRRAGLWYWWNGGGF